MMLAWMPGPYEWVIIILLVLLLFGGRKLPELARGLGKGLREFKRELHGVKDELTKETDEEDAEKPAKPEASAKAGPKAPGASDNGDTTSTS